MGALAVAAETGKRRMVEEGRAAYETPRYGMVPVQVIYDAQLSHTAVRVYAALALHANPQGRCYPSQAAIAKEAGMSRQSVSAAIHQLIERGYLLKVNQKRQDGGDDSCRYLLTQHPLSNAETPPVQKLDTPPVQSEDTPCPKIGHKHTNRTNQYKTDQREQTTTTSIKVIPKREQAPAADAATARPRVNPTWDALVEVMGYTPEARPERSRWGKVVKELNELRATPEEIQRRAARMIARWGRDHFSVNTIPNQWTEFAHDSGKGGRATNGTSQQGYGTSARPAIGTIEEFAAEAAANRAQEQLVERALACGLTFDDLVGLSDEALERLCDDRERESAGTHAD